MTGAEMAAGLIPLAMVAYSALILTVTRRIDGGLFDVR